MTLIKILRQIRNISQNVWKDYNPKWNFNLKKNDKCWMWGFVKVVTAEMAIKQSQ